jgi:hypothetical protein
LELANLDWRVLVPGFDSNYDHESNLVNPQIQIYESNPYKKVCCDLTLKDSLNFF